MPITNITLGVLRGMQIQINEAVGVHEQNILLGWARAWSELSADWQAAAEDIAAMTAAGETPSRAKVMRAQRVKAALEVTRARLDQLLNESGARLVGDVPRTVLAGADWEARLIGSQFPEIPNTAQMGTLFNKVDERALEAIVRRSTGRIVSLHRPIGAQAEAELRLALMRGVALGRNPRQVAQEIMNRTQGAFNGGRNRALVIARTEMLDAHRAAAAVQDAANAQTLTGWQWVATLDQRTCPSCWGQHGTLHPLEEPGPLDHQQGRCARVPKTKSWADLGFDLPEPPDMLPDARATFSALSREEQEAIMGAQRLALLDSGAISWDDLSTRRTTAGWRDSFAPTPTKTLLARSA